MRVIDDGLPKATKRVGVILQLLDMKVVVGVAKSVMRMPASWRLGERARAMGLQLETQCPSCPHRRLCNSDE